MKKLVLLGCVAVASLTLAVAALAEDAAKPAATGEKKPAVDKPAVDKKAEAEKKPEAAKPEGDKGMAEKPADGVKPEEAKTAAKPKKPPVKFPKDYRKWSHAKSMVIPAEDHPLYGFHHVYVETKGLKAYQAKKPMPANARIVVPFYKVENKDGMVMQGELKMVAVMQKDKKAKDTGGWWYAAFDPAGKMLEIDAKTACYDCHAGQKERDYLFSEWQ